MSWIWLNIPAALVCVAAICGLPLWLLHKHPGWHRERGESAPRSRPELVYLPSLDEELEIAMARWTTAERQRR